MGAVLNEFTERLVGAVENARELEAAGCADRGGQLHGVSSRRMTRKDVVGDGAEREHVEVFAETLAVGKDFRGHVGGGWVIHEEPHVRRCCEGPAGSRSRRAIGFGSGAIPGIPVENLQPRLGRGCVEHEDTAWGKRAVDHPLLVNELHDLGQLADEIQPGGERESAVPLRQEMVEPNGGGIVLEDDCRAEFVLGELHRPQDARVLKVFNKLKLADGRPLARAPSVWRYLFVNRIHPDPPLGVGQRDMVGLPVLESLSLIDLLL